MKVEEIYQPPESNQSLPPRKRGRSDYFGLVTGLFLALFFFSEAVHTKSWPAAFVGLLSVVIIVRSLYTIVRGWRG